MQKIAQKKMDKSICIAGIKEAKECIEKIKKRE